MTGTEQRFRHSLITVWTLAVLVFVYLPGVCILLASLTASRYFTFPIPKWGVEWWQKTFNSLEVHQLLQTSVLIALCVTAIAVVIGFFGALAFARYDWKGRSLYQRLVLLPIFFPQSVLGLALLLWFNALGLNLSWMTAVFAHLVWIIPVVTLVIAIQVYGFDPALEEAAFDLGASRWQVFREVTVPVLFPGIFSGSLFAFLLSWGNFPLSLFTTGADTTVPEYLYAKMVAGYTPGVPVLGTVSTIGAALLLLGGYGLILLLRRRREGREASDEAAATKAAAAKAGTSTAQTDPGRTAGAPAITGLPPATVPVATSAIAAPPVAHAASLTSSTRETSTMLTSIAGKSVIVTGASKGIGKGIATVFARQGAKVLIVARNLEAATQCAEGLKAQGGTAVPFAGDVTKKADMDAMAKAAVAHFGGIDILCANAGIFPQVKLEEMTEATWDQVLDTNLKGTFLSVQACIPELKKSGQGRIILTSSITGPVTGFPGWAHYGATKAGQLGFMRTACIELAKYGITVNSVLPGNIKTEGLGDLGPEYERTMAASVPLKRLGTVEDIGNAALFFASKEAAYITGQQIIVDGGQILPESLEALAQA